MPKMGRPDSASPNQFRNVSMAARTQASQNNRNVGDSLNRMAGIREDSRFVDAKTHNKLDKDGFLKLLSHQLQNQDPMQPMDQKQFAADLAQFSQLEQLANLNVQVEKQGENSPAENKFYGASFIGKEVLTQGTSLEYDGNGDPVPLPFKLPQDARELRVRVFDSRNQMVAQIERDGLTQGSHTLVWDGVMNDGTMATKDSYRFEVKAWNDAYEEFEGETQAKGLVTGVSFEFGETVLSLDNGQSVFLRDVINFKMPKANNAARQESPVLPKQAASAYNQMNQLGRE